MNEQPSTQTPQVELSNEQAHPQTIVAILTANHQPSGTNQVSKRLMPQVRSLPKDPPLSTNHFRRTKIQGRMRTRTWFSLSVCLIQPCWRTRIVFCLRGLTVGRSFRR
ncbi:hypothetical protein Salat_2618200 [Sesamum alatum]|uniref:Uncharacterized protein n=1 Tax=Sesamum alatum TaxID=300844 RepID=A0AAE1XNH6_9LAMI|nr:hypothetical protein Salat_2618200 [Sesamum alatum]